jgi:hypothetical protein
MKSLLLFLFVSFCTIIQPDVEKVDSNILIGTWKLDMTPKNPNDENFAMMRIKKVKDNTLKGTFYREGVEIRDGRINIQTGTIYGALVSGDNSGDYNTSFYFKDGKLYGSTHALERGFLAVWVATKE